MQGDPKKYEIGYLLTSSDGEESLFKVLIQHQADVFNQGKPSEIRLAYPIKKSESALFGYVQFSAVPENAAKIKDALKLNSKILRFLMIKLPPKAVSVARPEQKSEMVLEQPAERVSRQPEIKITKPAVLSNEALEERLEEILK